MGLSRHFISENGISCAFIKSLTVSILDVYVSNDPLHDNYRYVMVYFNKLRL